MWWNLWTWSIGAWVGIILAWLIFIGIWVVQIIRLSKRKDKTLMWIVLILGFAITPFLAGLIGLFLGRERERLINAEFYLTRLINWKNNDQDILLFGQW